MRLPPAFHHRNYRIFWLGQTLAWAGTQMGMWALFWHIRSLTDQPLALGVVGLIRIIPILLLSLFAGLIADAFNRRYVLVTTQSLFGLIALTLGVLTLRNQVTLGLLYVFLAMQAMTQAFDLPASQSIMPNLVPAKDLHNAFSVEAFAYQIGSLVGPALGGRLIASLGQGAPYLVSAGAFFSMVSLLLILGPIPQSPRLKQGKVINFADIAQGVKFTMRNPLIFGSMLLDFFATSLTRADTLMPIIARDILGVGPVEYGWLSAAQSLGSTLAGVFLAQIKEFRHQGRILLAAVSMVGIGTILFGTSRSFPISMLALAAVGASDAVSSVIRNTIRQLQTPDQLRGRMVSVNQIFFMGGPQLGEIRSGIIGQFAGVPLAITSGGAACLLALGWIAYQFPQLRRYDGGENAVISTSNMG
jgi:MFS family permease